MPLAGKAIVGEPSLGTGMGALAGALQGAEQGRQQVFKEGLETRKVDEQSRQFDDDLTFRRTQLEELMESATLDRGSRDKIAEALNVSAEKRTGMQTTSQEKQTGMRTESSEKIATARDISQEKQTERRARSTDFSTVETAKARAVSADITRMQVNDPSRTMQQTQGALAAFSTMDGDDGYDAFMVLTEEEQMAVARNLAVQSLGIAQVVGEGRLTPMSEEVLRIESDRKLADLRGYPSLVEGNVQFQADLASAMATDKAEQEYGYGNAFKGRSGQPVKLTDMHTATGAVDAATGLVAWDQTKVIQNLGTHAWDSFKIMDGVTAELRTQTELYAARGADEGEFSNLYQEFNDTIKELAFSLRPALSDPRQTITVQRRIYKRYMKAGDEAINSGAGADDFVPPVDETTK